MTYILDHILVNFLVKPGHPSGDWYFLSTNWWMDDFEFSPWDHEIFLVVGDGWIILNFHHETMRIFSWWVGGWIIVNFHHETMRFVSRWGVDDKINYGTNYHKLHHEKNLVASWWSLILDADFEFVFFIINLMYSFFYLWINKKIKIKK